VAGVGGDTPIRGQITFLPTTDLEATQAFYGGVLGLALARDQGICRIFAAAPGAYLGFCDRGYVVPDAYRVVVTLLVDDVAEAFERLRAAGADVASEPRHDPRFAALTAFVRDPNGYLVELQRFDEPLGTEA
jgi:predicted enzyme related to lactoylglutathione lyase